SAAAHVTSSIANSIEIFLMSFPLSNCYKRTYHAMSNQLRIKLLALDANRSGYRMEMAAVTPQRSLHPGHEHDLRLVIGSDVAERIVQREPNVPNAVVVSRGRTATRAHRHVDPRGPAVVRIRDRSTHTER